MTSLLIAVAVAAAIALIVWSITSSRRGRKAFEVALDRIGFRACPEDRERLQFTVTALENNKEYRYEILEPRRLARGRGVYYYVKRVRRNGREDDPPSVEEEVLFEHQRPSAQGLVLVVKQSSLPHGPAAQLIGSIATVGWDSQADDLSRLEVPPDLAGTNVIGALGPSGSRLYDLVDSRTISVVQTLGDCGATFVRFRNGWCSVASVSAQIEFRIEDLIGRLGPLL